MTVRDLIAALAKQPPDNEVVACTVTFPYSTVTDVGHDDFHDIVVLTVEELS